MLKKYQNWIDNYKGEISRKCVEVSTEMKEIFPELRIAKGLVQISENEKWYPHQWLVSEDEEIIDPTRKQWLAILQYKEIKDDDPKPIYKCMNCGEWVFDNSKSIPFCSEECFNENASHFGREQISIEKATQRANK